MKTISASDKKFPGVLAFAVVAVFNFLACRDIWLIPWGKGFNAPLSYKWGLIFLASVLIGAASLFLIGMVLWRRQRLHLWTSRLLAWRNRLGFARWVIGVLLVCFPAVIMQFTYFGFLLTDPAFRLWLWVVSAALIGILFTQASGKILDWPHFLVSILVTGCAYVFVSAFRNVTSYPFSLSWSEGNRFWDYSILFGRARYDYPAGQPIFAYIDRGRQLIWGLPFLVPHWSIAMMRAWDGLLFTVPYIVLGWLTFRARNSGRKIGLVLGLWAYLFLNQSQAYTPLVLCAILVAVAWMQPLWLALPLVAVSGYFAELSRWTWALAPAAWAGMLAFGDSTLLQKQPARVWGRAAVLAIAGLAGAFLQSLLAGGLSSQTRLLIGILILMAVVVAGAILLSRWKISRRSRRILVVLAILLGIGIVIALAVAGRTLWTGLVSAATGQSLLWYRLLPNATYGTGILIGLLIACLPLAAALIYLHVNRVWKLSSVQQIVIIAVAVAFLGVGLVASVKIGGGGDLHNLDMFFIGMLFAAALAWHSGQSEDWANLFRVQPAWTGILSLILIVVPVVQPLLNIQPLLSAGTYQRIATLAGPSASADVLPPAERIGIALETIQAQVTEAKSQGEVLFMDQRQLLTFGYVRDVALVPEYEKKFMMDQALSGNMEYFQGYYRDLANRRFSLIITEPLNMMSKGDTRIFGNENDVWVNWVTAPTLCFYEPLFTFRDIRVELLVPRQVTHACDRYLNP